MGGLGRRVRAPGIRAIALGPSFLHRRLRGRAEAGGLARRHARHARDVALPCGFHRAMPARSARRADAARGPGPPWAGSARGAQRAADARRRTRRGSPAPVLAAGHRRVPPRAARAACLGRRGLGDDRRRAASGRHLRIVRRRCGRGAPSLRSWSDRGRGLRARGRSARAAMTVQLAASGKVFLAGEYAVLDPGRPALVAGIDWKMHAVAEPGARGVQIVHRPSGLLWDGGQAPAELRFAARAALLAMAFCRKPDGVRISFEDDLAREGRKLGLGGSAAACVLAVRAVCALADRRSGEDEILALAAGAHWAEQGGSGSGADVAAAALGGILEVRSRFGWQSAEEAMALPADRVAASRPLDVRRLAIPPELRLLLVDTGAPANTRSLVREVRALVRLSLAVGTAGELRDLSEQLVEVERLRQISIGVQLGRVPLYRAVGTQDQEWRPAQAPLVDLADELPSVHHRHHQVEQDASGLLPLQYIQRFLPVRGHQHTIPLARQAQRERLQDVRIVVDDEHSALARAVGCHACPLIECDCALVNLLARGCPESPGLNPARPHLTKTIVPRCPSCRKEVKPREENPAFPFCSARCRATDLARWFTGSYRVPGPLAEAQAQKRDQEDKE